MLPLGSKLEAAKDALTIYEARNIRREDFDLDKVKPTDGMTVANWADSYFGLEEVKIKRSIDRDRPLATPLKRLLGDKLLTNLCREDLFAYRTARKAEGIIRGGRESTVKVSDGTIKIELSLLRRMVNLARDRGIQTSAVSFRGAMPQANTRERILTDTEAQRLFAILPKWFRLIVEVARETALSEGDLLRLTDEMIDREQGVIEPDGSRIKTGVRQVAPLTARVAEILDEIEAERMLSKVRNVQGLVFTRDNGKRITKDAITGTLKRACRDAKVKNFRFHDLRHCAKTTWARKGIPAESAMLAAGHSSFQMHQRYIHLQRNDIAKAFGILQHGCNTDSPAKKATSCVP
ncbi:MAG TPA: site-specific integrase [Candidatus Binatia bacterium]